jgi:cytochrome b6-f complex iron-sulfur subunit
LEQNPERRRLLRVLATGCLAAVGLPHCTGCSSDAEADGTLTLDRSVIERAGRTVVRWNDQPVEVRIADGRVEARSLVCTHLGCVVRWVPEEQHYSCPCHEGFYDARGNPIAGPPTQPLRSVPVRLSERLVVIGG